MLARRRNLMLARARRAVGRKGRVALAGALTGAGKFLSNKAQNYVRRKLTNKKSSFQNVKVEGNGGQISDNLKSQNQNLDNVLQAQGMTRAELNEQIKYQKTVEQLLGDKVAVTDAEVNTYMTDNKASLPTDNPDQVKSIVKQQLAQQKLSSEYQTYVTELKAKAKVTYFVNY